MTRPITAGVDGTEESIAALHWFMANIQLALSFPTQ